MMQVQPLTGIERDEMAALVDRLQQAARPLTFTAPKPVVLSNARHTSGDDLQWAKDMQLPREFFDYFLLERAA